MKERSKIFQNGPITESNYYGMGIVAKTLKELQDKVSKIEE